MRKAVNDLRIGDVFFNPATRAELTVIGEPYYVMWGWDQCRVLVLTTENVKCVFWCRTGNIEVEMKGE